MNFVVGVDQLAGKGAVDASPHSVDGVDVGHARIGPGLQGIKAVQGTQSRLSVKRLDVVAPCRDDMAGQIALVAEVVRDLRSAHPGGVTHLVNAGVGDAALEHQPGGRADDARPRRQSLAGEPRCAVFVHVAGQSSSFRRRAAASGTSGRARRPFGRVGGEHA